jgi:hypothetical protein
VEKTEGSNSRAFYIISKMGEDRLRIPLIIVDRVVMPGIKLKITVQRLPEEAL